MTVVTEGQSQDGPRPTPNSWSRLQERTTDQGQYLTRPPIRAAYSCGHSAGFAPVSWNPWSCMPA